MCTIGVGKTLFHVDGIEKNAEHMEKVRGDFVRANREKSNLIGWRQTLTTSPTIKLTGPRIKLTGPRIKLTGPKIKLTP